MDLPSILHRIETQLELVGLSAATASRAAGLSSDAIRNLRRAVREGKDVGLSAKTLTSLAPILRTTETYLMTGVEPGGAIPASVATTPAQLVGRVEAGSFREVDDLDQSDPVVHWVPRDEEFPDARILLFDVSGDSMNDLKPFPILAGSRAVCLDYADVAAHFPLRDRLVVVVQRSRDGGLTREWSIKQIEYYSDRIEFHPRSTNPRHKPIVVPFDHSADDGVTVEVIAVLRDVINPFRTV